MVGRAHPTTEAKALHQQAMIIFPPTLTLPHLGEGKLKLIRPVIPPPLAGGG